MHIRLLLQAIENSSRVFNSGV